MDTCIPERLAKRDIWDSRAKKYGTSRYGYKAICSYGSPYVYNRYIDIVQRKAFLKALRHVGIKGKRVLDVGCGVGRWCRVLYKMGAEEVVGIDISGEMIKLAEWMTKKENVSYRNMPISEISFPSGRFDVITCVTVLQHVTDEEEFRKSVGNLVRLLKRNGKLVIMEVAPSSRKSKQGFNENFFARLEKDYILYFSMAGVFLTKLLAVDILPLKHNVIRLAGKLSKPVYYFLLYTATLLSFIVDYIFSGTTYFRDHSWHKTFIFSRM